MIVYVYLQHSQQHLKLFWLVGWGCHACIDGSGAVLWSNKVGAAMLDYVVEQHA